MKRLAVMLAMLACVLPGAAYAGPAHVETVDQLVDRCGNAVAHPLAVGIITVESGGVWWAVNDNDRRLPALSSPNDAMGYAERRIASGGDLDVGIAQLNSSHLEEYHLSVREAFDPCVNVHYAMLVMSGAWKAARTRWGFTPYALYKAMEAYNGGAGSWQGNAATKVRVAKYAERLWAVTSQLVTEYGPSSARKSRPAPPVVVLSSAPSPHRVKVIFVAGVSK